MNHNIFFHFICIGIGSGEKPYCFRNDFLS